MIAPEGKIIFIPIIFFLCLFSILSLIIPNAIINWMFSGIFAFAIFCTFFFRNPKRKINSKQKNMVAPADGKIVQIIKSSDKDMGEVNIISIFLSVFNVHRQWVPFDSKVLDYQYNKGAFLGAFFNKASDENEQSVTYFETGFGNYKVKQIAGFIARRIINYMSPLDSVSAGDNLGFIRFGSRVDIILPQNFKIDVSVGDKVRGCQTVLGEFNG